MKLLILNSDSPNNRGDRAILAGNIILLQQVLGPGCEISAVSEYPERDGKWFGVGFIDMPVQSLSPFSMLKLMRQAKRHDAIFWGGGEILKDYTNISALLYWAVKIFLISKCNPNIYGMFQGIGPTHSRIGKRIIRFAVERCKVFFTRDDESRRKLLQWGVRSPVIASFDPAILARPKPIDAQLKSDLANELGVPSTFLDNYIGVGPRNWFHYRRSSWIPFKYRKYFPLRKKQGRSRESERMKRNLASLLDGVIEDSGVNVVFFPMHLSESENDAGVSRDIISYMRHGDRARVLDKDKLAPNDYMGVIGAAKLFIGVRLHSTILATVAGVPSFVFYYVDKGRLYFEQVGLLGYSAPIERLLDTDCAERFQSTFRRMLQNPSPVQEKMSKNLASMESQLIEVFAREMARVKKG